MVEVSLSNENYKITRTYLNKTIFKTQIIIWKTTCLKKCVDEKLLSKYLGAEMEKYLV